MSNEESQAIAFQSPEVLMDAWETGQQLARRWGSEAVRSQVRGTRNAEPFTYSWWRTQGALAYLGALHLYGSSRDRETRSTQVTGHRSSRDGS
jgi:hypothetical protein